MIDKWLGKITSRNVQNKVRNGAVWPVVQRQKASVKTFQRRGYSEALLIVMIGCKHVVEWLRNACIVPFSTRPPLQRQQSRCQPLHNPSPRRQDPRGLPQTHPWSINQLYVNFISRNLKSHLLHSLPDIPVNECTLRIHKIKLVIWEISWVNCMFNAE